jgi:hypothetical protein
VFGQTPHHYRRRPLGGISEQASMTVDMGKFSVFGDVSPVHPFGPQIEGFVASENVSAQLHLGYRADLLVVKGRKRLKIKSQC